MTLFGAESVPSLWFDEGWTLAVARNWVEFGNYALQLNDGWVSAAPMAHPFSVTVPVAFSFKLLGVGVFQGRLPSILFTLGITFLLFILADQLFNLKTAWVTLLIFFLFAPQVSLNPLLFGRQVLGETPMLFYLLLGFVLLPRALSGSTRPMLIVAIAWGLALVTKKQLLPFWLLAMFVPIMIAFWTQKYRIMKQYIAVIITVVISLGIFTSIQNWIVGSWPSNGPFSILSLYSLSTWTWDFHIRIGALIATLRLGLFAISGLIISALFIAKRLKSLTSITPKDWSQLSLLVVIGSWIAWFAMGSMGWPRYFYPILVLSTITYSNFLLDWTGEFKKWPTYQLFLKRKSEFWKTLIATVFIVINIGFVIISLEFIPTEAESGIFLVSEYFENRVDEDALVETYDSELIFLLRQPIHYPPDSFHVDLNRRTYLRQPIVVSYDLTSVNPDYIIEGPQSQKWQLYKPIVETENYQFVHEYTGYKVYERVRDKVTDSAGTRKLLSINLKKIVFQKLNKK
jgi:hypothetical protein